MAASRTHPPTFLTLLRRSLERSRCKRILVAVSGGGDSMALLHGLARFAPRFGLTLAAQGIDHGLRPAAGAELAGAAAFAERLGVPFSSTSLRVAPGGNLQARAREARYDALAMGAVATGSEAIATGHHQRDRAETVLLALLRGASARGLASLRDYGLWRGSRGGAPDAVLWRPLLRTPKSAIEAHLVRHRIAFATDPSNRDPRFSRVRMREAILPLLLGEDPNLEAHLGRLADELAALLPLPADLGEVAG